MASPTNTKQIEAVLANPPDGMPSDLTLAFLQESKDRGAIIAILVITSFVMIVVALRSYARYASVRGFGLDDWLALLALVSRMFYGILAIILTIHVGYTNPIHRARCHSHQFGIRSALRLHSICPGQRNRQ